MNIACITSDDRYLPALTGFYRKENIRFFDYFKTIELPATHIYLIFSPIYHNRSYIYYDILWKRFLFKNNPDAVLLTAGFKEGPQHNNYLDLLNLPAELQSRIKKTKTVGELWTPVYCGGLRMEEKLQLFFRGHGRESVLDVLHKIRRKIHLVERELKAGEWSYDQAAGEYLGSGYITERWKEFEARWGNYFEYFAFTPFRKLFQELDLMIRQIRPYFLGGYTSEELYFQQQIPEKIGILHSKLTEIRDQNGGKKEL